MASRWRPTWWKASTARSPAFSPAWTGRPNGRPRSAGSRPSRPTPPSFPLDLVERFLAAAEEAAADLVCARSAGRTHPVFGLWPVAFAGALRSALVEEGLRKIDAWTARHRLVEVSFPAGPFDPFFNLNSPEDLAEAARLVGARP